nr:MAG TPA: hypothetical protein [Caudoviricetes sp.]
MLGKYIMGSRDKIKVKDLAYIQRLEIELDVPDIQAIAKIEQIIDTKILDGLFSLHFVATQGLSYECFGYKKYTNWIFCMVTCYAISSISILQKRVRI